MGELFVWLSTHPDVQVRFNHDYIFRAFKIRVIKGRYISEYVITEDEYETFLKNDKYTTKLIISIINNSYDEIEKKIKKEDEE